MSLTFERVPNKAPPGPPLQSNETPLDFAHVLSIDLIRQHCKIEDIISVMDEQLELYRAVSIEAAEHYTGMLLSKQRTQTEVIPKSRFKDQYRSTVYRTQYPITDGKVYLYGSGSTILIQVTPGSNKVPIPNLYGVSLPYNDCCQPCPITVASQHIMYTAGFANADHIPWGVILGCLKYIAWSVGHPGDEILSVRNRIEKGGGSAVGTNNAAWASGALELWRQYSPEAV